MSASLISAGIGLVTNWLTGKQKVAEANAEAKAKTADKRAEFRVQREKGASKSLRFFSYAMFSAGIIVTVAAPEYGERIWISLDKVPDWYLNTFLAMNGAVWAIAEAVNAIGRVKQ
jgi:hypothetical protein